MECIIKDTFCVLPYTVNDILEYQYQKIILSNGIVCKIAGIVIDWILIKRNER